MSESYSATGLNSSQEKVAALAARGLTNREIAEHIGMAEHTVRTYVSQILSITGCSNRTDLAVRFQAGQFPVSGQPEMTEDFAL